MKKLFLTFLIMPFIGRAQPIITQANLPKMFDELVYTNFNTCLYDIDSGELVVWDFSKCTLRDSVAYDYVKVPTSHSSKFPNATFSEKYTQYMYTDYSMLSVSGGEYKNWGYISANSPFKRIYSDARIVLKYPFGYMDKYNDNFSYKFTTPVDSGIGTGYVYVRAAGSGKLKLPNGVSYNNALMVITNHYGKDTPGEVFKSITFEWYVAEHINPIVIINQNYQLVNGTWYPTQPSVSYQKRPAKAPVTIKPIVNNIVIKISPNPCHDLLNVNGILDGPASLKIYNNLGVLVFNNVLEGKSNTINTSQLPCGVYSIEISGKGIKYQHKLVVQH
jgi:hypothetical protein